MWLAKECPYYPLLGEYECRVQLTLEQQSLNLTGPLKSSLFSVLNTTVLYDTHYLKPWIRNWGYGEATYKEDHHLYVDFQLCNSVSTLNPHCSRVKLYNGYFVCFGAWQLLFYWSTVYNIVLVSNIQQSDSVTYISFFRLFFILDYCVYAPVQSCPTLCDPIDSSPPGSSACGILQARILEWVSISSSEDLPDPGIEPGFPVSLHWQVDCLSLVLPMKPYRWLQYIKYYSLCHRVNPLLFLYFIYSGMYLLIPYS